MKAKVVIPKGWRRVRTGTERRDGDMWLVLGGVAGVAWEEISRGVSRIVRVDWQPVIRRVKGGKP